MGIEQTLVILKPDVLARSLTGNIITALSDEGLKIAAIKTVSPNYEHSSLHYHEHKGKPFFQDIVEYLMGLHHNYHRVIAMVWHGYNAIQRIRDKMGPPDPRKVAQGHKELGATIRQKYGQVKDVKDDDGRTIAESFHNSIHGSQHDLAEYEIKLWFEPEDFAKEKWFEASEKNTIFETDELIRLHLLGEANEYIIFPTVKRKQKIYEEDGKLVETKEILQWKKPFYQVLVEIKEKKKKQMHQYGIPFDE